MNLYFKVQGFASKQFVQHNLVFNKIPKINILTIALSERYLQRFSQTCELWRSKANWWLRFSLLSVILTDLLGNKTLLWRVQKVRVCDWWISIPFVCLCVSGFVACDRNYDWRQRKTQLWRRLMNFRVRMFVKSAVRKMLLIMWHDVFF